MKKIITFCIFIQFAFSCFIPSVIGFSSDSKESCSYISGSQSIGDIIIVDDEGDGDYVRIKDALNHANPYDIIEVYSGTYYENNIIIEKQGITFKGIPYELGNGYDTGKPFINGEGKNHVIEIKIKSITITGFRIENAGGSGAFGIIGIWKGADNCTISYNDISYSIMGCIGCSSNNNRFIKNNISNSVIRQGIVLGGECNIISDNFIFDVEIGIALWDSNHNTITGNKIRRCSEFGIDLASSDYNNIEGNSFEENAVGLYNYFSVGCNVNNNNFIDNREQAQFSYGMPFFRGYTNRWNGNYWNSPRLLPYPIWGGVMFFPLVQFDWHPAKALYDI